MSAAEDMPCPSCRRPLRRFMSRTSLRCWLCDGCKGVAAETRSLDQSVRRERIVGMLSALRAGSVGPRKCPRCQELMPHAKVSGGQGALELDGCEPCELTWFDFGELRNLQSNEVAADSNLSFMTPQQRLAWRVETLRDDAKGDDDVTTAGLISLALGVPYPEPLRARVARPYATWATCIAVIATSIAAFASGEFTEIVRRFGMIPSEVRAGHWSGVLTHFFLHANGFHLAGNVLFLFVFGVRVEAILSWVRFLSLIALATIAGALIHASFAPRPDTPLIGASGGVSGVLAAHAVLRPRAKVRMRIYYRVYTTNASMAFLFWIALQIFGILRQVTGLTNVSALGHVGGAALGIALGLIWKSRALAIEPSRL
jgi:membrane associated rhomboid family serine protease